MEEGGILEKMGKLLVQGKKRRLMSIDRVEMTQISCNAKDEYASSSGEEWAQR